MPLEKSKENDSSFKSSNSWSAPLLERCNDEGNSKLTNSGINRGAVSVRHGDSLESDAFLYRPYILSYCEGESSDGSSNSKPKKARLRHKLNQKIPPSEGTDLAAMSVINLYKSGDNLDSQMDTER